MSIERSPSTTEDANDRASITELRNVVLLEALPSPPRRRGWIVLGATIAIAAAIVFSVREVSRMERALTEESAKAVRVVTYEVTPGGELRMPIEPDTDIVRLVVHAAIRGHLLGEDHTAQMTVALHGALASRTETHVVKAPGSTERVTPEDRDLSVGDPLGLNIDVHGIGTGTLTVSLASVEGADRLLVRAYRREAVHAFEAVHRSATIDDERREHFARRAGELDWLDLEASEQATLIGARWRKVGALGEAGVVLRAVDLAPPRPTHPDTSEVALGTYNLLPIERLSIVVHGPGAITARLSHRPQVRIVADVHEADGSVRTVEGRGQIHITCDAGRTVGVELRTDEPEGLTISSAEPSRLAMPEVVRYWRATPERPLRVAAGVAPLALRTTVRRPLPRADGGGESLTVRAMIAGGTAATSSTTRTFTTTRSAFDRYEGRAPELAPSEHTILYALVPARGVAELAPETGAIDIQLAELDPDAAPFRAELHVEPPVVREVGASEWNGWVARRPTNAAAFLPDAEVGIRVDHRFVQRALRPNELELVHLDRPPTLTLRHDDVLFVRADKPFTVEVTGSKAIVLPFRLFVDGKTDVIVRIDGPSPRRREAGLFDRFTLPRTIGVDHDARSAVILGEDLEPGRHDITFTAPPGATVWVHLPWKARALDGSGAHWVAGDFEP